jgi:chromate transporter
LLVRKASAGATELQRDKTAHRHWAAARPQNAEAPGDCRLHRSDQSCPQARPSLKTVPRYDLNMDKPDPDVTGDQMPAWREVFLYFLFLGFVNIGGPVAQITMMFNHMVEKRHWLTQDRFVRIMAFCHVLPGPEALQLAIYVGYLKRRLWGGILAGLTFIVPGAAVMIVLSWLYVKYGQLPPVTNALYVLKPAVLGIIAAGIIKLGQAAIRSVFLAVLLVGAFAGMRFAGINFLLILLIAGVLNLSFDQGRPLLKKTVPMAPALVVGTAFILPFTDSRLMQVGWLFLKTGLLSFGGAYASLVFVQQGAVAQHHWLSDGQLLDGVALSVATPGPFMLFTSFVGYVASGVPGAIVATFCVFLPSFVFVIAGVHYVEQVRDNRFIQAFLAGVSAAVVGVIAVVSLDLIPEALVDFPAVVIAIVSFLLIAVLKRDVAMVAIIAMVSGAIYSALRGWH